MNERRRAEDMTEPQSTDEFMRQIWRDVRDIKSVTFGKDGLCERMTIQETIVSVITWVVGIGVPALSVVVGWIVFFQKKINH